MSIDINEVNKVADLAKLTFTDEEKRIFASEFSRIIDFVQKISELDVEDVYPMTHAVEKKNVIREDIPEDFEDKNLIIEAGTDHHDHLFTVPKIIEH